MSVGFSDVAPEFVTDSWSSAWIEYDATPTLGWWPLYCVRGGKRFASHPLSSPALSGVGSG